MSVMKRYLEEKITEFARLHNISEEKVYQDNNWYSLAIRFAQQNLKADILNENK